MYKEERNWFVGCWKLVKAKSYEIESEFLILIAVGIHYIACVNRDGTIVKYYRVYRNFWTVILETHFGRLGAFKIDTFR